MTPENNGMRNDVMSALQTNLAGAGSAATPRAVIVPSGGDQSLNTGASD